MKDKKEAEEQRLREEEDRLAEVAIVSKRSQEQEAERILALYEGEKQREKARSSPKASIPKEGEQEEGGGNVWRYGRLHRGRKGGSGGSLRSNLT